MSGPARNPRAQQKLRRASRHARCHLRARRRRASCADRPERRRQDHLHQSAHRRADAEPATCCSRARTSPQGPGRAGQARHRPHLPDQPAVPRPVGAGERLHGDRRARRRCVEHGVSGGLAPRRHRRGDGAAEDAQARRHRRHTIPELPYGRQRLVELAITLGAEAAGAAARRAGRRRAERREPHHPRRHRRAAADIGVLIIDHDMDLVFRFAKKITVLVRGAVFAEGTPKEIGANPTCAPSISGRPPKAGRG